MSARAVRWRRRGALCACGARIDDNDPICRSCGRDAGLAEPIDVAAIVTTDTTGVVWLHATQTPSGTTTLTSRRLDDDQLRALARVGGAS